MTTRINKRPEKKNKRQSEVFFLVLTVLIFLVLAVFLFWFFGTV